jgi:endonuclease III
MADEGKEQRVHSIHQILGEHIPESNPLLHFDNCYQLLISVIMSAQTTDAQVNEVTPVLFARFPKSDDLANAPQEEVEQIIHSTGFFRSKARNIRGTARMLMDRYDGVVPESMAALVELPGVGRKSANVVLGHCFGQPAVIVDTHFSRVVRRIGLTEESDPTKIEQAIKAMAPPEIQYRFSMLINRHGRRTCNARSPRCTDCPILKLCDHGLARSL